jgi:5'-nucleotidase
MESQPLILITNDDGINAPGIKNLVEVAKQFGRVVVVAPDSPQSGMGHAITIGQPLRLHKVEVFEGVESWQTSGTPVDCVKLARDKVLDKKPDLCLSGINHGANHSINIIYSGTMSAAMEAAIENIPSAGFSFLDYNYESDMSLCKEVVKEVVQKMLHTQLPPHTLFNVNIPKVVQQDYKGLKLCRQAYAKWHEEFDEREDPRGEKYYWMTGKFVNLDKESDTDVEALKQGFASIVPVKFDLTDYHFMQRLREEWQR